MVKLSIMVSFILHQRQTDVSNSYHCVWGDSVCTRVSEYISIFSTSQCVFINANGSVNLDPVCVFYLIRIIKELQNGEDARADKQAHLTSNITCHINIFMI